MGYVLSTKEGVILKKNNSPKNNEISKVAGEIVLKKDSNFDNFCFDTYFDGYWHVYVFDLKII